MYPKEIEMEIDQFPEVLESAVIGVPHPDMGEGVTALVVLKAGHSTLDEQGMIARLQMRLAKFKVPKRIIAVPSRKSKVRRALRQTYASLFKS
jgi:malonyl-CoA/methylmalonyl-CoA synthetase